MGIYVYSVEQMRALEQAADAAGHSYDDMMELAGGAVAEVVAERWPGTERRVLILVGPGNNGGDGLVAGRALARRGMSVAACLWKRDRAERRTREARDAGVSILEIENEEGWRTLERALQRADVIIDALLGTGVSRPIEGELAEILVRLRTVRERPMENASLLWPHHPVCAFSRHRPGLVAVDVPSGLYSDSGEVDPATVAADITVTFAGPKRGMLVPPGSDVLGEMVVADIGVPTEVIAEATRVAEMMTPAQVASLLPPRPASGHKGTFGRILVVGGSSNYVGAPGLTAQGAARVGAGLVTLAVPELLVPILAAKSELTSMTWLMLPHDLGAIRPEALKVLDEELSNYDALVLGMGLGQEEVTQDFVYGLLGLRSPEQPRKAIGFLHGPEASAPAERLTLPATVLDADALNALAAFEGDFAAQLAPECFVLTPHPGEMARLTGREPAEIQEHRLDVAREQADDWKQVVVLKGAYTVVAAPDGRVSVSPFATPVLATAGTGDVLAGMIAGFLAQGLTPYEAAQVGVYVHGLAGVMLAGRVSASRGAVASDLPPVVRDAITSLL